MNISDTLIDRRRAKILIGGQITRETRERLIDAILEDGTGPGFHVYFAMPDELMRLIVDTIAGGRSLSLADNRARDGRFPAIEAMCRKHGLAFWRHSYARARHEGEIRLHLPNAFDQVVLANQAGIPYATHRDIRDYATRRDLRGLVTMLESVLQPIPALSAL